MTFSSVYAAINTAIAGLKAGSRFCDDEPRMRSMVASAPIIRRRPVMRMSPRKKIICTPMRTMLNIQKARLSTRAAHTSRGVVSGGITWARVWSMSFETGTIS